MSNHASNTAEDTIPVYTISVELCRAAEWLCANKEPDATGKVYDATLVTKLKETKRSTVSRIVSLYRHRVRQWNIPGCNYRVSESGDLLRINSYVDTLPPHKLAISVAIPVADSELISAGLRVLMKVS